MELVLRNAHLEGDAFLWEGNSTGILLIHGFTATTAEVRLLGQWLHDRGFTVSGPLLPGHGTTWQEMSRCRWQDWAHAADNAYTQLAEHCENVIVGGESMGAILALYLASKHPEVAGVLAYAPALRVPSRRVLLARLLVPFTAYRKKPGGPPTAVDARWQGYAVNPLRSVIQLDQLQQEMRRRLPLVHQPTLVVQGRRDQTIDPHSGEIILNEITATHREMHWLDQSTHCLLLDCEWEQAANLTLQFIVKVIPSQIAIDSN
jgi:carboxylesterase